MIKLSQNLKINHQKYLNLLSFSILFSINTQVVQAQITPDTTLGNETSVVKQINDNLQNIEGGALRGTNLFHSFLEFNVNNNNAVYFTNPTDVINIFSRVTGDNLTQILGTLGVLGNANLYFVNPNGILFGPNANLDLTGSFVANSGNGFILPNGAEFSATNPQIPPLLTINTNAPMGIKLEGSEGIITNQADLTLTNSKNVTLAGNKVINEGNLTAANIQIYPSETTLNLTSKTVNPRLQPDTTLGAENTEIEAIDPNNDKVIGGAERGANLFHSFLEFNVESGRGVYFANPAGIDNIFSRVTGANTSEIRGTLGILGTANLYLLNPNSLLFGSEAKLDLNGSFLATTADSILFENDYKFSASNPDLPSLLTINIPSGLEVKENAGDIVVQTGKIKLNESRENGDAGQLLDDYQIINDKNSQLPDRILGELSDLNDVDLYQIYLLEGTEIKPTTVGGSAVDTQLFLFDSQGLGISANDDSQGGGQSTVPPVNQSGIYYLGISSWDNNPLSAEGPIFTNGQFEVPGSGANSPLNGWVSTGTYSSGLYNLILKALAPNPYFLRAAEGKTLALIGGNINIDGGNIISPGSNIYLGGLKANGNLTLTNGIEPQLPANLTRGDVNILNSKIKSIGGGGGSITIEGQNLNILGKLSEVIAGIDSDLGSPTAQSGDIKINIADATLIQESPIFNNVEYEGQGNGGDIVIDTSTLTMEKAGVIGVNTSGQGNAGQIKIAASDGIIVDGLVPYGVIVSRVVNGAVGKAGGIVIDTSTLTLKNGGVIDASNYTSQADGAGDIKITAHEGIFLSGANSLGHGTYINTQTFGGVADAGNIVIDTSTLTLQDAARITAGTNTSGKSGQIDISATNGITLRGGGTHIAAEAFNTGDSKGIVINTSSLNLQDGSLITASTHNLGNAGGIDITATDKVSISGTFSYNFGGLLTRPIGGIVAFTFNKGNAGDINVNTPNLQIGSGAGMEAFTLGEGNAGSITINSPQLVNIGKDSRLTVETSAAGQPGNINVTTDRLTIGENAQLSATATATSTNLAGGGSINLNANNLNISGKLGIFAETQGQTPAGNLTINPQENNPNLDINFTKNGFISASTTATGDGGNITITAPENLDIQGLGKIAVETSGNGNAGAINITSKNLNLSDGVQISANTNGEGQAGDINLAIAQKTLVTGSNTGILANTTEISQGNSGNINLTTQNLVINNEGVIAVDSKGTGEGGNVTISTEDLGLNKGKISAETTSGNGGNIKLTVTDLLTLNNGSKISTTAGNQETAGNGGNIEISARNIFSFYQDDNDITANAFTGKGGQIFITTESIFGIQPREELTFLSDITASSALGLKGLIQITRLNVDPTDGLSNLPEIPAEVEIAQGCQTGGQGSIAFYDLGKGGLAAQPGDFLSSDNIISSWIPLIIESEEQQAKLDKNPLIFPESDFKYKYCQQN